MTVAFLFNAMLLCGGCVAGAEGAEEESGPSENIEEAEPSESIAEAESELSLSNAEYVTMGCTLDGGAGSVVFDYWYWTYYADCATYLHQVPVPNMTARCTEVGGQMHNVYGTSPHAVYLWGYRCVEDF
jgi:hypothetical protein